MLLCLRSSLLLVYYVAMEFPNPFKKHIEDTFEEAVKNTSDSAATTIVDELRETGGSSPVRVSLGEAPAGFKPENFDAAVIGRVYVALAGRVPCAGSVTLEAGKPPQKTSGPPYLNQPKPQGSDIVYTPLQ